MKIRLLIRGVILTWSVLDFSILRTRMANQGSLDATFLLASEQVVAASVTEQQGQSVPKGNPGGEQEGRCDLSDIVGLLASRPVVVRASRLLSATAKGQMLCVPC